MLAIRAVYTEVKMLWRAEKTRLVQSYLAIPGGFEAITFSTKAITFSTFSTSNFPLAIPDYYTIPDQIKF